MSYIRITVILCTTYLLFSYYPRLSENQKTLFSPDNEKIQYVGRIDLLNPKKPRLIGAGTYFMIRFKGKDCDLFLEDQGLYNNHNYISIAIDGEYQGRIKVSKEKTRYCAARNLKGKKHTLLVCKDTESQTGYIDLTGILCSEIIPIKIPSEAAKTELNNISWKE